jgi:hypothetical protein
LLSNLSAFLFAFFLFGFIWKLTEAVCAVFDRQGPLVIFFGAPFFSRTGPSGKSQNPPEVLQAVEVESSGLLCLATALASPDSFGNQISGCTPLMGTVMLLAPFAEESRSFPPMFTYVYYNQTYTIALA